MTTDEELPWLPQNESRCLSYQLKRRSSMKRAKASKLTVNEFVRRAAEIYNPSDDDEALLRLIAQLKQTTHEASAALQAALDSCASSDTRIAAMEASHVATIKNESDGQSVGRILDRHKYE